MNTTISLKKTDYGYIAFFAVSLLLLATTLFMANPVGAATFAPLTGQASIGSRGNNVINLQTFLASDYNIYPQAMITGYYGGFTRAAVRQFQVNYNIAQVGAVGPITLARINNVIAAGRGIDVYAPSIYNASVSKTANSATFNWNTTESARGKVYYSTNSLSVAEAVGNFSGPTIVGGTFVVTPNFQLSQSITANGLTSNTTYYYIIEVQDASGNVSVTVQSSFVTN